MSNTAFTIDRFDRQPTIAIRSKVSHGDLTSFFDRSFGSLASYIAEKGGRLAGPAFSRTYSRSEEAVDIEVGFPLAQSIDGNGEVTSGEIPAVEVACTYHIGSYTALPDTYAALVAYVESQGRKTAGVAYEFYVDNPAEVAVEGRRTRVCLQLL